MAENDRTRDTWYTRVASEYCNAVLDVKGKPAGREDGENDCEPLGSPDLFLPAGDRLSGGGVGIG